MQSKYLVSFTTMLLVGCASNVKVTPNKIPDAYLNQPYQTNIEITGGTVVDLNFHSELSDNSFKIIPSMAEVGYKHYNLLTVTGTPTRVEPVYVYIAGDTYGTNFPGKRFKKEYIIEVKASE